MSHSPCLYLRGSPGMSLSTDAAYSASAADRDDLCSLYSVGRFDILRSFALKGKATALGAVGRYERAFVPEACRRGGARARGVNERDLMLRPAMRGVRQHAK